jgi:hypothetical protein
MDRPAWVKLKTIGKALFTDVRSAAVGSVFGAIVGLLTAAWANSYSVDATIYTNEDGYAQPMIGLIDRVERSGSPAQFSFSPSNLKEVYVCEFSHIEANSQQEILLKYLDKYSECFHVREKDIETFVISPNSRGDLIREFNSTWFCNCPE